MNASSKKLLGISVAFLLVFFLSFSLLSVFNISAGALSGSQFQPGRIIDDSVFYDTSAMTPQQIQSFLNSKMPSCDTNGEQMYNSTQTRAQWAAANGRPTPPYTCLKDYTQAIPTITNGGSDLCQNSVVGGTKSAAQIIYDSALACGINPQVLIVMLQKEQSLITDSWPWPTQYDKAMGYACPDSGPNNSANCDAAYFGFFNQVYNAAKAYRRYEANPDSYNYKKHRNNTILYHPNSSCGTSNVFIENQATASLYIYTPYRPNQAALDNLYGTGDGCSAYGNRNFWRMFNDWFGSTLGGAYKAQYFRQGQHPSMFPGDTSTTFIDYKNIGINDWYDSVSASGVNKPVNLAATQPINRASQFSQGWPSSSRASVVFSKVFESNGSTLASNQHVAEPGQIVRYTINFRADSGLDPGVYREWFQPILEGSTNWNIGGLAWLQATVVKPTYEASYHSQSGYPVLGKNDSEQVYIRYKNTGNQPWYHPWSAPSGVKPVTLATSLNINRSSVFGATWGFGKNRPTVRFSKVHKSDLSGLTSNQNVVQPGEVVEFAFNFTAPENLRSAYYREWFQPIREGSSDWDMGGKAWLQVKVTKTTHQATFHSQCSFPVVSAPSNAPCFLKYKNTGTSTWYTPWSAPAGVKPVTLATSQNINRSSQFGSTWGSGKNRPAVRFTTVYESDGVTLASNQDYVKPGQIARFNFTFTVNSSTPNGSYREWFQPILEGSSSWNINGKAWIEVTVN